MTKFSLSRDVLRLDHANHTIGGFYNEGTPYATSSDNPLPVSTQDTIGIEPLLNELIVQQRITNAYLSALVGDSILEEDLIG